MTAPTGRGLAVGARNNMVKHDFETVQRARRMWKPRVFGYGSVAKALGVKKATVVTWCTQLQRMRA